MMVKESVTQNVAQWPMSSHGISANISNAGYLWIIRINTLRTSNLFKSVSEQIAQERAAVFNQLLEQHWKRLFSGNSVNSLEDLASIANSYGFDYKPAHEFTQDDIPEIINRLMLLEKQKALPEKDVAALLGKEDKSVHLLSEIREAFFIFGEPNLSQKSDDSLSTSTALHKELSARDLLPTEEHVVYSLRHSFKDRLTKVEPPEKVQATIMGHKYSRGCYGDGPSLNQKKKWLDKIALKIQFIQNHSLL